MKNDTGISKIQHENSQFSGKNGQWPERIYIQENLFQGLERKVGSKEGNKSVKRKRKSAIKMKQ